VIGWEKKMAPFISRRELLKRAGLAGMVAVVPPEALATTELHAQQVVSPAAGAARLSTQNLTAAESEILEAVVARLIPTDATGPGASEAGAARYIDRALGGALASSRQAYATGLAALNRFARASRGKPFTELAAADQDAVLTAIEAGGATGFDGSASFFNLVRTHTIQGTFCDPFYGGNAGFVGWDLIGYPGVRTLAGPEDQRLGVETPANHKSAYDYEMFTKASARAASPEDTNHGD
jgi:gluconate 2-dehydrogenase gamma chain